MLKFRRYEKLLVRSPRTLLSFFLLFLFFPFLSPFPLFRMHEFAYTRASKEGEEKNTCARARAFVTDTSN